MTRRCGCRAEVSGCYYRQSTKNVREDCAPILDEAQPQESEYRWIKTEPLHGTYGNNPAIIEAHIEAAKREEPEAVAKVFVSGAKLLELGRYVKDRLVALDHPTK